MKTPAWIVASLLTASLAPAWALDCPPLVELKSDAEYLDQARNIPGKGESQARKWFRMLDADGDGRISRGEAQGAFLIRPSLKEWFESTDLDGDGYLTVDEVKEAADRRRAKRLKKRDLEAREAAEACRQKQQQADRSK